MSLRQVGIERAALCEETKSPQMQVTAERQYSEKLHHEPSTTKAKEAALITRLEKHKAAAAAQNAIYSADTARLLEQIAKLERDSIPTRFRALYDSQGTGESCFFLDDRRKTAKEGCVRRRDGTECSLTRFY
jgi:cell division protein FtsB